MQSSNSPGKLLLPFAAIGAKNTIPVDSQVGIVAGKASLQDGFPPLTRTPLSAGGVPPSGLDMNGILYEMSAPIRWAAAGGGYQYDPSFATDPNVDGYPKGSRIMRSDGSGYWLNTVDDNTTDPEAGGAGWVPDYTYGIATVPMSGSNVTLTALEYGRPIVEITGTLSANVNLLFPDSIAGEWTVHNAATGNFSVTCKTAAGIGVPISTGDILTVMSDGVDFFSSAPNSSAIKFIQAGTGAVLQNVRDVLREKVTAANFGAIGNAVADDTAALQLAINYAASIGVPLDLGGRNKTYKITAALAGLSNLSIKADGAIIDMSAISSGEKTAIVFAGSSGAGVAITSGASEYSFTINVANTSAFAVGDFVQVSSGDYYPYSGGSYNVERGEIKQIRSMVANTSITFTEPLVDTYTTSPVVRPVTWVNNVSVEGVQFSGLNTANTGQRGVALRYVKNFNIRNNTFSAQDYYQVECSSSIIGRIQNNNFTGVFYDGVTGTIFYGIAVMNSSQWVDVSGNIGNKVRHLVVTTSTTSGQGVYGQPLFINIHHNICRDAMAGGAGRSFAFEQHGFGRYVNWEGNEAHGCYSGFRLESGVDNTLLGNIVAGYAYQGIIVGNAAAKVHNCLIQGNNVSGYTGEVTAGVPAAFRLELSLEVKDLYVVGNKFSKVAVGNNGQAFSLVGATTHKSAYFSDNVASTGDVENASLSAVAVINTFSGYFTGNHFHGWRNGYNAVAGCRLIVEGGSIRNFSAGASGYGFYSNSDRCICKNVHFENINTPIRLDTLSTNNLTTLNTMTGCTVTTPSNLGTGNTVSGNYVV